MSTRNRRFLLRERPSGRIGPETFELVEDEVPQIAENEALIQTLWISLDPTNRAWIGEEPTYLPPVAIDEVMRARRPWPSDRVEAPGVSGRPARGRLARMA